MNISMQNDYEASNASTADLKRLENLVFSQLRDKLNSLNAPKGYFAIGGSGHFGELCIELDGDHWAVYQSEKGTKYNYSLFSSPWAAGNFFMREIIRIAKVDSKFPELNFDF